MTKTNEWVDFGAEVASAGKPKHRGCSVRSMLDALPEEGAVAVQSALSNPNYGTQAIYRVVKGKAESLGVHVPAITVFGRHRRNECACGDKA